MDEQLIKFIELCLADGVITDKEREVIFRKAKKLGVDEDECEILIDSFTQRINKVSPNEKQTPSKNKRNFTPKKVSNLKPAKLNQEKELLLKVGENNSKLNVLNAEYNALVEDIAAVKKKSYFLIQSNEADFNSYIKKYKKDKTSHINAYIRDINSKVSMNHGNTSMIIEQKDKDKLITMNPLDRKKYIEKNIKWDISQINQGRKAKSLLHYVGFVMIVAMIWLYISDYVNGFTFSILLIISLGIGVIGNQNKEKIEKNENDFTDVQLAQIIDGVNKIYKKQIDELLERKEMIKKVEGLHNTAIKVPQRNQYIYIKKELQQVISMLKNKNKYGY
tara:strand:- start:3935 stop:4936 length:1002 start_codon:yes stop_codon:yes gene_type:complete